MKIFKETQRFNQGWLIVLMILILLTSFYAVYQEFQILDKDDHSKVISLITTICTILVVNLFIFSFKLEGRIDEKGITYQFFPTHFKTRYIAWPELDKCYVREYSPIKEYDGWGLKGLRKKKIDGHKGQRKGIQCKRKYGYSVRI